MESLKSAPEPEPTGWDQEPAKAWGKLATSSGSPLSNDQALKMLFLIVKQAPTLGVVIYKI